MNLKVIDTPPGLNKTKTIIAEINANPTRKYIFATPLCTEITRIINECPALGFVEPSNENYTKSADFVLLVMKGRNIATTHELFLRIKLTPALCKAFKAYT